VRDSTISAPEQKEASIPGERIARNRDQGPIPPTMNDLNGGHSASQKKVRPGNSRKSENMRLQRENDGGRDSGRDHPAILSKDRLTAVLRKREDGNRLASRKKIDATLFLSLEGGRG